MGRVRRYGDFDAGIPVLHFCFAGSRAAAARMIG
jgi:hypothetical protein